MRNLQLGNRSAIDAERANQSTNDHRHGLSRLARDLQEQVSKRGKSAASINNIHQKLKSNKFTLSDFYDQLSQLKNMGSLDEIAAMMPGMNAGALKGAQVDEKAMARTAAIIQSMTPYERETPSVLNSSRKRRIALGSGVKVEDINKLLKQFDMMNQMMKQFSGPGASRKMKRMGKLGGMGGLGGFPGM